MELKLTLSLSLLFSCFIDLFCECREPTQVWHGLVVFFVPYLVPWPASLLSDEIPHIPVRLKTLLIR